uniref:3CxxC-type domain-containing protein n=1 Tax=Cyprinus carpio TaxID=7962 RepID=A0A8C2HY62_CYPCA
YWLENWTCHPKVAGLSLGAGRSCRWEEVNKQRSLPPSIPMTEVHFCSLCRKGWESKRVQVLFHFHLDTKWRRCTQAQWEDPNFPVENTDVLIERLARNIRMKFNGPHESAHCEDCHKGVACTQ